MTIYINVDSSVIGRFWIPSTDIGWISINVVLGKVELANIEIFVKGEYRIENFSAVRQILKYFWHSIWNFSKSLHSWNCLGVDGQCLEFRYNIKIQKKRRYSIRSWSTQIRTNRRTLKLFSTGKFWITEEVGNIELFVKREYRIGNLWEAASSQYLPRDPDIKYSAGPAS